MTLARARVILAGMAKPKRPRNPNQLAKLIVDIATGETPPDSITPENVWALDEIAQLAS